MSLSVYRDIWCKQPIQIVVASMLNSHSGRAPKCNEILLGWLRIASVISLLNKAEIGNRPRNDRHGNYCNFKPPAGAFSVFQNVDTNSTLPWQVQHIARVQPSDARVRSKLPHTESVLGQLGYGKVGQAKGRCSCSYFGDKITAGRCLPKVIAVIRIKCARPFRGPRSPFSLLTFRQI